MRTLILLLLPLSIYSQNIDSVWAEINKQGIKKPDILMRQAMLETMWLKCEECSLRFNNIFGFRHKSAIKEGNPQGYLEFETWQDCIYYYKSWQEEKYDSGCYYTFLEEVGYAESQKYCETLKVLKRRW